MTTQFDVSQLLIYSEAKYEDVLGMYVLPQYFLLATAVTHSEKHQLTVTGSSLRAFQ